MTSNTIKISGMIDIDIDVPDSVIDRLAAAISRTASPAPAQPEIAAPPASTAFPDSNNGKQAEAVADFLKEAGKTGATEQQIKRRFGAIRSTEQLRAVLQILPSMLYRKTKDEPAKEGEKPVNRWTFFYA